MIIFIKTTGVNTMYIARYKHIVINHSSMNKHTTAINSIDSIIAIILAHIPLRISEIKSVVSISDIVVIYPAKYKSSGFIKVYTDLPSLFNDTLK